MIEALGHEIAAVEKRGGGSQVPLRGGERVGPAGDSWGYRFVVSEELSLRDDTPVRVTAGDDDVPGVLVSIRDGELLVALEQNLGPKIPTARLVSNDTFLVERLREQLEKVRSGETQINLAPADRVVGAAKPATADAEPDPMVTADWSANPDQLAAVRRSLGSDTTFIWGPPGTGKTTTLARIVEAHYRAGRSVLLVSNTNIAVDTALEKVADRLKGETEFYQGLVIRQGPILKEELRRRFGEQVVLEEVVARLGATLRQEKEALTREAGPLGAETTTLTAARKDLDYLTHARHALAAREKAREMAGANVAAREGEAAQLRTKAAGLRRDLERVRTMGPVRRFFSPLSPAQLERRVRTTEQTADAAVQAAQALLDKRQEIESAIATLRSDLGLVAERARNHPPAAEIQARLETLGTELGRIRERLAEIDGEMAELEQQVLARCRVLATTVYRTYLGAGEPRHFDVVVIDEASMLVPPLVYYAAGLATQSVTVAGDFRQLPPIVMADGPQAEAWLKCDVFEKAGIPQLLERHQPPPHLVALGTQYRMREPICALLNELFYTAQPLQTHPSANRGGDRFPLGSAPLLYVDTAPFQPWTALRVGSYSRYNLFHALLVCNLILHLDKAGFLPAGAEASDAVGVVAPYASQARLIQALLDDRLGDRAAGMSATVHRFQGNEKAAMVLDLTDSLGTRLGRFLQATRVEEDGARLLNVAASRAKHHVVLIANFEYLRAKAPPASFVRRFVEHFETHGEAVDVEALLPFAENGGANGLRGAREVAFDLPEGAAGAFTEGTFYPAFEADLSRARETIVLFSPFATAAGTGRWVDHLRAAMARGVRVRILTRPPGEGAAAADDELAELLSGLRDLGVSVDLRSRMHEKIAVLDGRILWHGSLNVLSHRDTQESMLRLDSPAMCQQLGRYVSNPAGRRKDEDVHLETPENPACPQCGSPTVWNPGHGGVWFRCTVADCDGQVNPRRRRGRKQRKPEGESAGGHKPQAHSGQPCPQAECDGHLAERRGRYGPFLGCTNFPACRHTENLAT